MKNNWKLQRDRHTGDTYLDDFDDYGYGSEHPTSIGDDISSIKDEWGHHGTVIGIIRDRLGEPVCYKVIRPGDPIEFDYIPADDVFLSEPCGSSEWSLGRYGYEKIVTSRSVKFRNRETGDELIW